MEPGKRVLDLAVVCPGDREGSESQMGDAVHQLLKQAFVADPWIEDRDLARGYCLPRIRRQWPPKGNRCRVLVLGLKDETPDEA